VGLNELLATLRGACKGQQHFAGLFVGAEGCSAAVRGMDMHPPRKDRPPCDRKLGRKVFEPAIVLVKRDVPIACLSVSERLGNAVAELVLHECDDAVPPPAPDAECEAYICNYGRTLRDVGRCNGEHIDARLAWPNDQAMPSVSAELDPLSGVGDVQCNNGSGQ